MTYLPRGIDPELLFSQVQNTMPYLFFHKGGESHAGGPAGAGVGTVGVVGETPLDRFIPARVLRAYGNSLKTAAEHKFEQPVESAAQRSTDRATLRTDDGGTERLTHFEYFKLCLSSHYLTCGTPVPTDVDNQIRRKLWPAELPLEVALEMAQLVLESRKWDFTQISTRFVYGAGGTPWEREALSGHLGEWFTVSCAAYCALKQYEAPAAQQKREEIFSHIADEVHRHSEIFGSLWSAKDGLSCLKAAASIAHNFGDLDRVMDMWDLNMGDPLRLQFYKLAVTPFDPDKKLRYQGRLWVAGELYKTTIDGGSMALENHRHFALRKPRCLRQSLKLLIPTGPFFDDWGRCVARTLMNSDGTPSLSTLEVVDTLKHGWERLPKTVGYGRALRGIMEVHPELRSGVGWGEGRAAVGSVLVEGRAVVTTQGADQGLLGKKPRDGTRGLLENKPKDVKKGFFGRMPKSPKTPKRAKNETEKNGTVKNELESAKKTVAARSSQSSTFQAILEMSQEQFEKKWNDHALREMDEIPSRA